MIQKNRNIKPSFGSWTLMITWFMVSDCVFCKCLLFKSSLVSFFRPRFWSLKIHIVLEKKKKYKTPASKRENDEIMHLLVVNAVNKSLRWSGVWTGPVQFQSTRTAWSAWLCFYVETKGLKAFSVSSHVLMDQASRWRGGGSGPVPVRFSRWRPRRWRCCPAGVWRTDGLWWRSRSGNPGSDCRRLRCRCPRTWWTTDEASCPLPPGGTVCSCIALYSVCRRENTAASSHPWWTEKLFKTTADP